jgi:hypothetical protein
MIPVPRSSRTLAVTFAVAVLLSACATSLAGGDYADKDFSLRFPAAMTRFATYGDVAGVGGASAGSKWSSSINPASTAWLEDPPRKVSISQQYSHLFFGNGTNFRVPAESMTVDTGPFGYFTGAAAQISTNRETMRNAPVDFYFAGDMGQLLWAKKLSKDWATGFAFTYTKSVARVSSGGMEVAKSNCDSYGIRGGALHRVTDRFLAGLVLDYGWSSDRTNGLMVGNQQVCDSTRQFLVRPGVSYEYMTDGTVYLDYQFGTFSNDTGTMNVNRILAGVEHGITKWLFLRAGTTIDPAIGSNAWTCGIGFYPASWFSLDVGYQYDMFPELREEFGRSHALNVSIAFTF